MPGFLEDMRYFVDLYRDRDCELILVNNANYHSPFDLRSAEDLDWPANPHPVGTLAHDGFIVARAIERLATAPEAVLHGHSRGGAVVLEAARQGDASIATERRVAAALLEAPVLPQGRTAGPERGAAVQAITLYLMPLFLAASRNMPEKRLRALPGFGPEKTRIFVALLAKRLGVEPDGWRDAAGAFSDDIPRSVADVDDARRAAGPASVALRAAPRA